MPHAMKFLAAGGLALAALAGTAPARAGTILHISASATVQVMPDQLHAELAAEATAVTPVRAQDSVNTLIGTALKAAQGIAGVTTSTGAYSVWYVTDPRPHWQARQTIMLDAKNGPVLLGLVGELQTDGLAVSDLGWQLAPKTLAAAQDKAEAIALSELKGRAEAAAKILGMHFSTFRQVWVSQPRHPLPIQPMALMAARGAPPNAVPAESSVVATVQAEVRLDGAPP